MESSISAAVAAALNVIRMGTRWLSPADCAGLAGPAARVAGTTALSININTAVKINILP
jgi:hypothetical protein